MNWQYQTIKITSAHIFLLCLFVISFCVSCNVGKAVVSHPENITCIGQERDALLKFKHHIQNDKCGLMSTWGNPNKPDCCTWEGVSCSNQSGHVIDLNLSGDPYWGGCLESEDLSPSLSELKHLKYLDLSSNSFYGAIPTSIVTLVNLTHLNLSGSFFDGNIPHQLGNLTRLTSIDLSGNYGLYAKSMKWISRLSLLREINLSGTDLSEATDWSHSIGNLRIVRLSGNDLTSCSVFQWLFNRSNYSSHKQSLEYLDLSGPIPSTLGSSGSLSYLDVSYNRLEGSIPSAIGDSHSILRIDLSNNHLQGPIPTSLGGASLLTYLDLSNNQLQGSIPSSLAGASLLSYLNFSINHLEGAIPSSIANLEYLEYLDLSRNNLSGNIPCKLDIKNSPYIANFSNNNLSGSIPKHLSYLGADSFQGNPSFRTDEIQGPCHKIDIGIGMYVSIGLGFYIGFWAFCGTLAVKNSWRHAYFGFIDHIIDYIYVIVAINLARFRRNFQV